ncbi:MAG: HAD-IIA family hydrolase [Armatimonadota bacterium]|jgi:4-nitrophenyl phosphatase
MTVRGVIFDLDGVLWRGRLPIEGAAETLATLRREGFRVAFCTNNSTRHRSEVAEKLRSMGMPAEADEVFTAGALAASIIARDWQGRPVLMVGEAGLRRELTEAGVELTDDPDVAGLVVMGWDREISFDKYRRAHRAIEAGAHFLATNPDLTFPEADGGSAPGCGGLSAVLVASTGVQPECHGKPDPALFASIAAEWGLEPHQVGAVGDRLDTDLGAARRFGCLGILVLSGVTTQVDLDGLDAASKPDVVLASVVELPALLMQS